MDCTVFCDAWIDWNVVCNINIYLSSKKKIQDLDLVQKSI